MEAVAVAVVGWTFGVHLFVHLVSERVVGVKTNTETPCCAMPRFGALPYSAIQRAQLLIKGETFTHWPHRAHCTHTAPITPTALTATTYLTYKLVTTGGTTGKTIITLQVSVGAEGSPRYRALSGLIGREVIKE